MELKNILVVMPHSGIIIPHEIPFDALSVDFPRLMRNVDWYTNWLYDFRDILGNQQFSFPYCSLILETNRHPDQLEESVPLKDALGEQIYRPGYEPSPDLRKTLSEKYLKSFHRDIAKKISEGIIFMLDAHSTVSAQGVTSNQIELMNFQTVKQSGEEVHFCPNIFIETYANELIKELPGVKITVNESGYHKVYGHVCGEHSVNAMTRVDNQAPAILQETNQHLYMNDNGTLNIEAIEALRRAFAQALLNMLEKVCHYPSGK